jgi:hypothetical protein
MRTTRPEHCERWELIAEIRLVLNWPNEPAHVLEWASPNQIEEILVIEDGKVTDQIHRVNDGEWWHIDYPAFTGERIVPSDLGIAHPDHPEKPKIPEYEPTPEEIASGPGEQRFIIDKLVFEEVQSGEEESSEPPAQSDLAFMAALDELGDADGTFHGLGTAKAAFLRTVAVAADGETFWLQMELSGPADPDGMRVDQIPELGRKPWQLMGSVSVDTDGVRVSGNIVTSDDVANARASGGLGGA